MAIRRIYDPELIRKTNEAYGILEEKDANKDMKFSYLESENIKEDEAIQNINLSKQTQISDTVFTYNPNNKKDVIDIAKKKKAQDQNFKILAEDSPTVANKIKNPNYMSIMKKDLNNLSTTEKVLQTFKNISEGNKQLLSLEPKAETIQESREAFKKGSTNINLAETINQGVESYRKTGIFANEKSISEIENKISEFPEREGFNPLIGFSEQLPNLIYGGKEALRQGIEYGTYGMALGAIGGAGVVSGVTAPAGLGLGFATGAVKGIFDSTKNLESAFAVREYSKMKDVNGNPINPEDAVKMANIVGSINGATEAVADIVLTKIGSRVLKGVLGKTVQNSPKLMLSFIRKIPMGDKIATVIEGNLGKYGQMPLRKAIQHAVYEIFTGQLTEIVQETSQEATTASGAEILTNSKDFDLGKVLERTGQVIIPTFESTLLPTLIGVGVSTYAQVGELYKENKLKDKSPDNAQDIIKDITETTGVKEVFVPVDKFEQVVKDSGLQLEETVLALGINDLYQESKVLSKQVGEDSNLAKMRISYADWIAKTAEIEKKTGKPLYKLLQNDVSFNEFSPSKNRSDEIIKRQELEVENIENLVSGEIPKQIEQEDTRRVAVEYMKEQLNNVTKPKNISKKAWEQQKNINAKVYASHVISESSRRGISPQQYFEQTKLEVATGKKAQSIKGQIQQDFDKTVKGAISFEGKNPIIKLFEEADQTTFLHETSHFWLRDSFNFSKTGKVNETFTKDWNDIATWLGIKDSQKDITRDQQEKFARSFEAYLLEGKAPNEFLKNAFYNIRKWMVDVYRNLKGLSTQAGFDIKMTDEVRQIMDKMLATEDELNFAVANMQYDKTIENVEENVSIQLEDLREEAYNKAFNIMQQRLMKELYKKTIQEIKSIKTAQKKQITAKLEEQPVFVAMKEIRREFNKNPKELSIKYIDLIKKETKTPTEEAFIFRYEVTAERLGSTGTELSNNIINALPLNEAIELALNNYIRENHPELVGPRNLKKEAYIAIHNEKTSDVLALEKLIFQRSVERAEQQSRLREFKEKVRKFRSSEINFEADNAKSNAKQILWNKPVREARIFLPYFTQERNWAIKANNASKEKDFIKAYDYKSKQILNFALGREAYNINKQVTKLERYLNKVKRKNKELFKNEESFNQIGVLLERFGLARGDYNPSTKLETLEQFNTRLKTVINDNIVTRWLFDERFETDYKDLNVAQLLDLTNTIKNIIKIANTENRLIKIMNREKIDTLVTDLQESLVKNVKMTGKYKPNNFFSSLQKTDTMVNRADGFKDNGIFYKTFMEPVNEAADLESNQLKQSYDKYAEIFNKHYTQKEINNLNKDIYIEELGEKIEKSRLLAMALNLGAEQNRNNLFLRRPVDLDVNVQWDEQFVMNLFEKYFTKKDWEFIQDTWDLLNEFWTPMSDLYKRLKGFTPAKVEAKSFKVTLDNGNTIEMRGGYYPLVEDTRVNLIASIRQNLEDNTLATEGNSPINRMPKNSFSKQRTGALYPLRFDLEITTRHIQDIIHDINFREIIIDFNKILKDPEFQKSIRERMGDEYLRQLDNWVNSIGFGERTTTGGVNWWKLLNVVRKNTTAAFLFYKVGIVTQNLANIALYENAVDGFTKKDVFNGSIKAFKYMSYFVSNRDKFLEIRDAVYKKSSLMRDRAERPDYTLTRTFKKADKFNNLAIRLMTWTDEIFAIPMWEEAYEKKLTETNNEKTAINYANLLVERAIGSGRKYNTSSAMRNDVVSLFVMFMSFFNTEYNRWIREIGVLKNENDIARFTTFLGSRIMFVIMSAVLAGHAPKSGEDKSVLERWGRYFLKEHFDYFTGMFPLIRNIPFFQDYFNSFKLSPIESVVDGVIKPKATIQKFIKGKATFLNLAEDTIKAGFLATGKPIALSNLFFNVMDNIFNDMDFSTAQVFRRVRPRKKRKL